MKTGGDEDENRNDEEEVQKGNKARARPVRAGEGQGEAQAEGRGEAMSFCGSFVVSLVYGRKACREGDSGLAGLTAWAGVSARRVDVDVLTAGGGDERFDVVGVGREDRDRRALAVSLGDRDDLGVNAGDVVVDLSCLVAELAARLSVSTLLGM